MTPTSIIVGAGAAGMMAALTAAGRGVPVLVLDAAGTVGGSLNISSGQLSAAGTVLQRRRGITDSPDAHYADVMRISRNTADPALVRLAVDNAARTLDWLTENGMEFLPEHPVEGFAHEPYTAARYYWGPDFGRSILRVLRQAFDAQVATGRITLSLNTTLTGLVLSGRRVTAVTARTPGGVRTYPATSVLLATGGYNANPELFRELSGHPAYGGNSYPHNTGGGLEAARRAGAALRGHENYLSSFGVVMDRPGLGAKMEFRHVHHPQDRAPWEIYVNTEGRRFVAEDEPSVDAREHALLEQPELRRYVVFDLRVLRESTPMITGRTNDGLRDLFDVHPMFTSARTLEGLAARTGLPVGALAATVTEYNTALGSGPDPFGRRHRPVPLVEGPFYAIRVQGASVTSTVGLAVGTDLRVRDTTGEPFANLSAAGELLGSGQLMGKSFCGGMMATPAMTFGLLYGRALAAEAGGRR
ncbi:FAD-dependent oxidoreductase [Actinomadura xylanilytica]|uniref:FAD-dependent oxidoreductase n=1 Tax=Actinomadura xylanilytica TaxID=887459 RepID=UPI00255A9F91|nr:FAD-binding protein [Actinomadura xylanilytica]MDL4774147.1 FAD-binding protein [Actinomadura xylanilytica]